MRAQPSLTTTPDNLTLTVMSAESKTASEAFTEAEFGQLGLHLNNGNNKCFVQGYCLPNGKGEYKANKIRTAASTIKWAYDSTRAQCRKRIAFAPYASNHEGMSRWGALDFDCHDGAVEGELRAHHWALQSWQILLNRVPCVIFVHSGRGWHTWCAWKDFKSITWIYGILEETAIEIGCPIGEGSCEILPRRSSAGLGGALRLPGSFNFLGLIPRSLLRLFVGGSCGDEKSLHR